MAAGLMLSFALAACGSAGTPDFDSLLLLPTGALPQRTFHVDLRGDGVKETVVVSRIPHNSDALRGEPCEDDEHIVVTVLEPSRYGLKVVCNKGVGFAHYLDCQVRDVDRDGRPEIAVNTMHCGADHGSYGWDFLRWEGGTVRWVGGAGGTSRYDNGGAELFDADGDGRLGVKAWSEWWHGNESHAEVHEHVTTLFHWRQGRLVAFKKYLYDDELHRVKKMPRVIGKDEIMDLDGVNYDAANQAPDTPLLPCKPRWLVAGIRECCKPQWSPDGKQIAFIQGEMADDIITEVRKPTQLYSARADGTGPRALTAFKSLGVTGFDWSPDGKYLSVWAEPLIGSCPPSQLWIVPVSGGSPRKIAGRPDYPVDWMPDSKGIRAGDLAYPVDGGRPTRLGKHAGPGREPKDWFVAKAGGTTAEPHGIDIVFSRGKRKWRVEIKPGMCKEPVVSPDGRHVAFQHWEGGEWNLYVVDVPR